MENTVPQSEDPIVLGDVVWRTTIPVADTSLYCITPDEAAFFKSQTGIDNDEDLKRHVLEVQAKAYKASQSDRTSPQSYTSNPTECRLHHILVSMVLPFCGTFGQHMHRTYSVTMPRLNVSTYSVYEHILKLGRERPNAILLDIGCCCASKYYVYVFFDDNEIFSVGVDSRKVASDGFPAENIISSDINNGNMLPL